jgi:hypothetical protein
VQRTWWKTEGGKDHGPRCGGSRRCNSGSRSNACAGSGKDDEIHGGRNDRTHGGRE